MISRTNKSFVWLWMAALLSASIGVSVQQVYCYCLGKTTVSLFVAVDGCQTGDNRATGTPTFDLHIPATDCCQSKAQSKKSCCEKPAPEKRGCTKKSTKVFQLKTEFEVASAEFKKLELPKTWAPAFSVVAFFAPIPAVQTFKFHDFEHPPPSLSGRMRCVLHGVYRC